MRVTVGLGACHGGAGCVSRWGWVRVLHLGEHGYDRVQYDIAFGQVSARALDQHVLRRGGDAGVLT